MRSRSPDVYQSLDDRKWALFSTSGLYTASIGQNTRKQKRAPKTQPIRLATFQKSLSFEVKILETLFWNLWIWGHWYREPPKALRVLSRMPGRSFFLKKHPSRLLWKKCRMESPLVTEGVVSMLVRPSEIIPWLPPGCAV